MGRLTRAYALSRAIGEHLEDALEGALVAARIAWPRIALDDERFAAHLGRVVDDPADLEGRRVDDLYLCAATLAGSPGAVEALHALMMPAVRAQLLSLRLADDVVDELTQQLRVKLFTGEHPAIASFGGGSDIRAWVRVIAVREAVTMQRRQVRELGVDDEVLDALAAGPSDVERLLLREDAKARLRGALTVALEALPARARLLVRMHHVDGVTLDELARLHGVHRATVARWLASARETLLDAITAQLGTSSDVALVASQLELSLARLLGEP